MSRTKIFIVALCALFVAFIALLVYNARQAAHIDSLKKDLESYDSVVRERARDALVAMKSGKAAEALVDELDNKAVQEATQDSANRGLITFGKSHLEQVNDDVIHGLADMGEPAVGPLIKKLPDKDDTFAAATIAVLKDYVTRLTGMSIETGDTNRKPSAVEALAAVGKPAVPQLVKALKSGSVNRKATVAWVLGLIGDPGGVDGLVVASKDAEPLVRGSAVRALGETHNPKALDVMIGALKDQNPFVVQAACAALSGSTDERTVPALIAFALSDANGSARAAAVTALLATNDPRASDAIEKAAHDPDPLVKEAAAKGLDVGGASAALGTLLADAASSDDATQVEAGKQLGLLKDRRAVAPLIAIVRKGANPGRWALVDALMKIGDARAVDAYIACLDDPTPQVRKAAAYALEGTKIERAREPLLNRFAAEQDADVLKTVVYALDNFHDERTVRQLAAGYDGATSDVVRRAIVDSLCDEKNPAVGELLLKALKDPSPSVRQMAVSGFATTSVPGCAEPLRALLKDPFEDVRTEVPIALAKVEDPKAVDVLCEALKDKASMVRVNAAISLGVRKDPRAIDALVGAAGSNEINMRTCAAFALTRIGGPAARSKLDEMTRGYRVGEVTQNYRSYIRKGDNKAIVPLAVALATCNDEAMAEDFWYSQNDPLRQYAWWWARAQGTLATLQKSKDTPARPKWQPGEEGWYQGTLVHLSDSDAMRRATAAYELGRGLESYIKEKKEAESAKVKPSLSTPGGAFRYTPRVDGISVDRGQDFTPVALETGPWQVTAECFKEVVDALKGAAGDGEWVVRRQAICGLGRSRDPSVAEAIGKALKDDERSVRVEALRAFAVLGSDAGVPFAIDALKDPEPVVRGMAAWFLADRCAPTAIGPLAALLKDENESVRLQAATALAAIRKPEGIRPLAEMLRSDDISLMTEAAIGLADYDTKEADQVLAERAGGADLKALLVDYPNRIAAGRPEDVAPLILALVRYGSGRNRIATVFYWSGNPALKKASEILSTVSGLAIGTPPQPNTDGDSPRNPKWPGATMKEEPQPADLKAKTIKLRPSGPPEAKSDQQKQNDKMQDLLYESGD